MTDMIKIDGRVLVFTDLHLGLKNNSTSRLAIAAKVMKAILAKIKHERIETCIFCGDWSHSRTVTDTNVLNVSYKLMTALAKLCKVYAIVGNHDSYMKNTIDINTLNIFRDNPNISIIDKTTLVSINGNTSVLVPWLGDLSALDQESLDMMFGHFEVSQKYLIKSYIEDHSATTRASKAVTDILDADSLLKTDATKNDAGNYIGDFVNVVKRDGTIFSGHIHGRREFRAKGREFIFVGSPYQQNLGEKDNLCGYYLINSDNSHEFVEIENIPKHVEVVMSQVVDNIDAYDFIRLSGNIVHKIYDVEVDSATDAKISQRINDAQPYEELLPDYDVEINQNSDVAMQNQSIELIKKGKLDYVKNYIDNIDRKILDEQRIDPDKLFSVLEGYYLAVAEEK